MRGLPVVTSTEMRRVEAFAYAEGESDEKFMRAAAFGIAHTAEKLLLGVPKKILLLVGKGNNGGDALAAGCLLLQKGYPVRAFLLHPITACSPLCQKMAESFQQAGGSLEPFQTDLSWAEFLIVALVGTGFQGKAEGSLLEAIETANRLGRPLLAVDIPSGLDGNTGEVGSAAIRATATGALGLPKIGFFIGKGFDHIGKLFILDFGLPSKYIKQVKPEAYLFDETKVPQLLPKIKRTRHKYERGYLLTVAGSAHLSGAAFLTCKAALRAGAGIVRLFHAPDMELDGSPDELIHEPFALSRFVEESKRAKAVAIGPGLSRTEEVFQQLDALFSVCKLPCVLDADALFYFSSHPGKTPPSLSILTPHVQEMHRLLGETPNLKNCQTYAETHNVTLVLKGAPTFIFQTGEKPLIIPRGDPGMATAGAGDVLTGVIGALLAQGLAPYPAAALGVFLHDLAGEKAALHKTSYAMIASDLIEALPEVFMEFSKKEGKNRTS
jgi:hydroxyethylthiazole kinase-like uncharacterized protein yjeF